MDVHEPAGTAVLGYMAEVYETVILMVSNDSVKRLTSELTCIGVVISPDGKTAACSLASTDGEAEDATINLYDLATGNEIMTCELDPSAQLPMDLCWLDDGRIAYEDGNDNTDPRYIVNLKTGDAERI